MKGGSIVFVLYRNKNFIYVLAKGSNILVDCIFRPIFANFAKSIFPKMKITLNNAHLCIGCFFQAGKNLKFSITIQTELNRSKYASERALGSTSTTNIWIYLRSVNQINKKMLVYFMVQWTFWLETYFGQIFQKNTQTILSEEKWARSSEKKKTLKKKCIHFSVS